MIVSIIGTGNTATVLARLCMQKGHTIRQIIARNTEAAKKFAAECNCSYTSMESVPDKNTDLVIVAISDSALPGALAGLHFENIPVVHTAGAVSVDVLKNISANYGVMYPLQSLRKDMAEIPPVPFLLEANHEATYLFIEQFAHTLSDVVRPASGDDRLKLHTAAVIVNNFTNYLYCLAEEFCKNETEDFNLLKPLIRETAERIKDHSPRSLLTGPAVRKDSATIDKHLQLLQAYPKHREIYVKLTEGLMDKE